MCVSRIDESTFVTMETCSFIIYLLSIIVSIPYLEPTPLRPSTSVASGIGNGNARRRPMSSYHLEPRSPRASPVPPPFSITGGGSGSSALPEKKGQPSKSPYHAPQPNAYPAPSQPAPPPPPRTVSKNAEPVPRYVSYR